MKIRKATNKDLKKIAEFFRIEFGKKPYNEKWTEKSSINKIKEYFSKMDIFVAEENKEIFGFIIARIDKWYDGNKGMIEEFVVGQKFQGKGIGTALIKFLEKNYKKNGVNSIYLGAKTDSSAFKFYNKKGYKQMKDFVWMKKKI